MKIQCKYLSLMVAIVCVLVAVPLRADDGFTLADIPEISNKEPIHVWRPVARPI